MKNPGNSAELLDASYAPEAEALLDELERSGQFRIGVEAELDDDDATGPAATAEYSWGRGSGSVQIQDWWTAGAVVLRVSNGIGAADIVLLRQDDSLMIRTRDGLDRAVLENYLGLIPDASTLRIVFADGLEWNGSQVLARMSGHMVSQAPAAN